MRIEKITNGIMNKALKGSHVKGHLNGFLIALEIDPTENIGDFLPDFLGNAVLKVKYQHDRAQTLVPSIPLMNLIDLSNMEFGSTNEYGAWRSRADKTLQSALNAGFGSLADNAGSSQLGEFNTLSARLQSISSDESIISFFVDLGSIYVDSGNELHFEIDAGNQSGPTDKIEAHVYTLSKDLGIAEFIEYDMDFDQNEMHTNIVEAFLCTGINSNTIKDLDIMVNATSIQYDCDTIGLKARAMLFSEIENVAVNRTLTLFRSLTHLPEDVQVKFFSDSSISDYYVLTKRVFTNVEAYLLGENHRKKEVLNVTDKLENDNPEMAKVLQLENVVKTSAEIKESLI